MFAAVPWGLVASFFAGLAAGGFVNWAVYALAWNRRTISPWSRVPAESPRRWATDRLPLWGWIALRRENQLHGRGFWVRPLAVEASLAFGWAALYWWEVDQQGLVAGQFEAISSGVLPAGVLVAPMWATVATFVSHGLLITLMTAASLIDIDEKTIPDGITVPGALLGLVLSAVLPMSLLPHVYLRPIAPPVGVAIPMPAAANAQGVQLFVEPVTLAAPSTWPALLDGRPRTLGLAIGLACFALWCVALTPRIWRGRRGVVVGLRVLAARVARELARPPLVWIGVAGASFICVVWYRGGGAWIGLLSALVGMIGGGAVVWAVRIVGSSALRKEAMGFGDVTLMMTVGTFLGWQAGIFIFFIAPVFGLVAGLLQVILRRDDVIPYGPYLCLATLVVMLRWASIWNVEESSFQQFFEVPWLVPAVLTAGVAMLWAMLVLWRNVKEALFRSSETER